MGNKKTVMNRDFIVSSSANLCEYVHMIAQIETNKYTLKQGISNINSTLSSYKFSSKPTPPAGDEPKDRSLSLSAPAEYHGGTVCKVLGGICGAGSLLLAILFNEVGGIMIFLGLILVLASFGLAHNLENGYSIEKIEPYYRTKRNLHNIYINELEVWKESCRDYQNRLAQYNKQQDAIKPLEEKLNELTASLIEVNEVLSKLYEVNVIFEKYRDFVPMCTIHEYLASGRCTELKGANGAYNLYESELRQNIIISNLESIGSNIEAIKKNQYALYQAVQKTNSYLSDIKRDIEMISQNTSEIQQYSRSIALQTKITADNTEALKWMKLLMG